MGVVNIHVEDPALHLNPKIKMAQELRPGKEFNVEVSEKDGKAMNYTIAIVDEGLLSLTTFRTPDPFAAFYAREALGVKTWDFYDYIYGAYGARLIKLFAVGGDEALKDLQDEKTNRFQTGRLIRRSFQFESRGYSKTHLQKCRNISAKYGRWSIAATNGQYGAASVNSTVNKPLMVSVALPALFTPGDVIDIPVTVFVLKDHIREVTVR